MGYLPMAAKLKRAPVNEVFTRLRAANPTPTTELHYGNAYQLLVAVVLSAQMTDKGVNKATAPLFASVNTPAQMVKLTEDSLGGYLKSINLWRNKTKNVLALSQKLLDVHGGEVPRRREELEALPGVGRKTANVVLNTLWGEPVMAVDTHVFRLARRLGLSKGTTPKAVEADLMRVIPPAFAKDAHHWLILHGRYVCVARNPKCGECVLADICPSAGTTKA